MNYRIPKNVLVQNVQNRKNGYFRGLEIIEIAKIFKQKMFPNKCRILTILKHCARARVRKHKRFFPSKQLTIEKLF